MPSKKTASPNQSESVLQALASFEDMVSELLQGLSEVRSRLKALQGKHSQMATGWLDLWGPVAKVDSTIKATAKIGKRIAKGRKQILRIPRDKRAYIPGLVEIAGITTAAVAAAGVIASTVKWFLNKPLDLEGSQSLQELIQALHKLESEPTRLHKAMAKALRAVPQDGSALSEETRELLLDLMDLTGPSSSLVKSFQGMIAGLSKEVQRLGKRPREPWVKGASLEEKVLSRKHHPMVEKVLARHLLRRADAATGKKEGDGTGVGLFLPLPEELAVQFPSLAPEDNSPPHVTLLYVGVVPEELREAFLRVVRIQAQDLQPILKAQIHQLDYFRHPGKDRTIAHMSVKFSNDLARFKYRLISGLQELGIHVQDNFPTSYFPHVTLGYLPDLDTVWKGPIPSGMWSTDNIEVWGLPEVYKIPFGI